MIEVFSMNSYEGMRILALVRDGDYAHAGEEEAIELAMKHTVKSPDNLIVDAGCGRGGTADYLHRNGWGTVVGLDIEPSSIEFACQTYPNEKFFVCDVCHVDKAIDARPDVICMFNVYYCLPSQPRGLRSLLKISKPGTEMVIFDHVDRGDYHKEPLMDAGEPFLLNPPKLSAIPAILEANGWMVTEIEEIHSSYIQWYTAFVSRIEAKRGEIIAMADEVGYDHVHRLYQGLLDAALTQKLGAAIIRATPKR